MSPTAAERRILATADVEYLEYLPYDLEGPLQADMGWLPISYDRKRGEGSYLMRMDPGARTIPHEHPGYEDFLILEGELIDSDGRVLRQGDFISYLPGTRHHSWTEVGCRILVFEWQPKKT